MTNASRPGAGERAQGAPTEKRRHPGTRGGKTIGPAFDPATRPDGGPSLAEEEQRTFHATHFTADPRGSAMAGSPPPGSRPRKQRGGTPPSAPARRPTAAAPKPKRRGGSAPG